MNGFSSAISAVGGAVGRYFSVVSFIPSLFLAWFTFALIASGAWGGSGAPDWSKAANAFTHLGNLALLIFVSIVIGMVVHPVQFALVQFFEGYWGTNPVAQRVRCARMSHHHRRAEVLTFTGPGPQAYLELQEADRGKRELASTYRIMRLSQRDEFYRLSRGYPESPDDIMPTRLGNVLRRYERQAGSQYKLDAVRIIRHAAFVAPRPHLDYLNDQRQLLDLSIRMCMTSIIAAFVAIVFLWHHGPWLAIALVPYGVAYLSYRGAIVVAHEYGATVCTLIDLNRFALYDSLHMQPPKSTRAERRMNIQLMNLIDHDSTINLAYEQPQSSSGGNGTAEAT
jgi:hypothetical protein